MRTVKKTLYHRDLSRHFERQKKAPALSLQLKPGVYYNCCLSFLTTFNYLENESYGQSPRGAGYLFGSSVVQEVQSNLFFVRFSM